MNTKGGARRRWFHLDLWCLHALFTPGTVVPLPRLSARSARVCIFTFYLTMCSFLLLRCAVYRGIRRLREAMDTSNEKAREACSTLFERWLPGKAGACNAARKFLLAIMRCVCEVRCDRWQSLLGCGKRRRQFVAVLLAVLEYPRGLDVMTGVIPAPAAEAEAEAEAVLRLLRNMYPRTCMGGGTAQGCGCVCGVRGREEEEVEEGMWCQKVWYPLVIARTRPSRRCMALCTVQSTLLTAVRRRVRRYWRRWERQALLRRRSTCGLFRTFSREWLSCFAGGCLRASRAVVVLCVPLVERRLWVGA